VRNRRNLLGLENLVSFLEQAVAHPEAAGQTFLVADNEDISTPALIRLLANLMHRSPRLVPFPVAALRLFAVLARRRNLVDQLCESLLVDSSKARRLLGWEPPVPLTEGLSRTVSWYSEYTGRYG
jgi:nucleoside-diphosphate-sugar epimerase